MKWIDSYAKGKLDLVCTLPGFGLHLVEVKHIPTLKAPKGLVRETTHRNMMSKKQLQVAKDFQAGGGFVTAGVVFQSSTARGSRFAFFDPFKPEWDTKHCRWVPYKLKTKFDIETALKDHINDRLRDATA